MRKVVFALLCLFPQLAFAHAVPVLYTPREGQAATSTVESIRVDFSERIEREASRLVIRDVSGQEIGRTTDSDAGLRTLHLPLQRPLSSGLYSVTWEVVSRDDGHFSRGAYSFSVGSSTEAFAAPTLEHTSTKSEIFFGFLEFLGIAVMLGAVSLRGSPRYLLGIGGCIALLGAGGSLLLILSSGGSLEVLGATRVGFYTSLRLGVLFAALISVRFFDRLIIPLVVIDSILRALVSHAAASFFAPEFSVALTAAHLFSKEFLVGLMFVGVFTRVPVIRSRIFGYLLCVAVPTGAYIVWLHLKFAENLFKTSWGEQVLVLGGVAGVAAALLVLIEWGGGAHYVRKFSKYLIPLTLFSLVAILYFSSVSAFTSPPIGSVYSEEVSTLGDVITLKSTDGASLLINSEDRRTDVVIVATLPDKSIGPILLEPDSGNNGIFVVHRSDFVPDGLWKVDITTREVGEYDAFAEFFLPVPQAFVSDSKEAHSSTLAWTLFVGAILFICGYYAVSERVSESYVESRPTWDSWFVAFLLFVQFVYLFGPNDCHHGSC